MIHTSFTPEEIILICRYTQHAPSIIQCAIHLRSWWQMMQRPFTLFYRIPAIWNQINNRPVQRVQGISIFYIFIKKFTYNMTVC